MEFRQAMAQVIGQIWRPVWIVIANVFFGRSLAGNNLMSQVAFYWPRRLHIKYHGKQTSILEHEICAREVQKHTDITMSFTKMFHDI